MKSRKNLPLDYLLFYANSLGNTMFLQIIIIRSATHCVRLIFDPIFSREDHHRTTDCRKEAKAIIISELNDGWRTKRRRQSIRKKFAAKGKGWNFYVTKNSRHKRKLN